MNSASLGRASAAARRGAAARSRGDTTPAPRIWSRTGSCAPAAVRAVVADPPLPRAQPIRHPSLSRRHQVIFAVVLSASQASIASRRNRSWPDGSRNPGRSPRRAQRRTVSVLTLSSSATWRAVRSPRPRSLTTAAPDDRAAGHSSGWPRSLLPSLFASIASFASFACGRVPALGRPALRRHVHAPRQLRVGQRLQCVCHPVRGRVPLQLRPQFGAPSPAASSATRHWSATGSPSRSPNTQRTESSE